MVYFGSREFRERRRARPGSERAQLIRLLVLLAGMLLVILVFRPPRDDGPPPEKDLRTEGIPVVSTPRSPEDGRDSESGRDLGSAPLRKAPKSYRRAEPAPFSPSPEIVAAIQDERAADPASWQAVPVVPLSYLFHRFLAGPDRGAETHLPSYEDISRRPELRREIRGERFRLVLTAVEAPWSRELPENDSGVTRFREVFAADADRRLHSILFIEKEAAPVTSGTDFACLAEFFRLHGYEDLNGRRLTVPQWVARRIEPDVGRVAPLDWRPVIWVGGVAGVALLILWIVQLTAGNRRAYQRRRDLGRRREDPPSSSPSEV